MLQTDKAHHVLGRVCHRKLLFPDTSANVTNIDFLELIYPKGMTGNLPLCPIMALMLVYVSLSVSCSTSTTYPNYPGTELGGTVLKLRKKIKDLPMCVRFFLRT